MYVEVKLWKVGINSYCFLLNMRLIYTTSTGVCITCTFLDSSTTDCVSVVHQQISQLSSSGLMNIESSHKFTRSGDTAYGCIEGVNLEQYQVRVFGGMKLNVPHLFFAYLGYYHAQHQFHYIYHYTFVVTSCNVFTCHLV